MIFLFSYFPILSQIASLRVLFGRGWWKKVSLTSSIGCEIVKGDISGHVVAREAAAFAVKSATEKSPSFFELPLRRPTSCLSDSYDVPSQNVCRYATVAQCSATVCAAHKLCWPVCGDELCC